MGRTKQMLALLAMALPLVAGCHLTEIPAQQGQVDENIILPEGKADNFFSNTAQEYLATARVPIQLEASWATRSAAEREDRARRIMAGKTRQIAWFLHVYLIDKSRDDGEAGEYGGLRAMVLDGSYDSDALKQDETDPQRYSYSFSVQVGGTNELLSKIRQDNNLGGEANTFALKMARLQNSQVVSFSHSGFGAGSWSPDTCDCEIESVQITLEPIDASGDAYLDYGRYLEDGVMDISVHFGWDYHARYDITHSRSFYSWLVDDMGFASPVAGYEAYNRLSGPLTRQITVNGQPVTVRVSIFRPDPCESWDEDGHLGSWAKAVEQDEESKKRSCPDWQWDDPRANANSTTHAGASNLMQDLKHSLHSRDAIIFSGHSGYTYGYALASWYQTSAGDLDPPEIRTLDLPREKSQLFVISGCDTYHVAQAFKDNPNKQGLQNADVITTTSFSNAGDLGDTKSVVRALIGDGDGRLEASSYGKLMDELNPYTYDYGWGHFTMYGVHGIDDNPLGNPLGDPSKSCATCNTDDDCGAAGNVCVRINANEKVCATECLHDSGCVTGQTCRQFGSSYSGYLRGMACVPSSLSCGVEPPPEPVERTFTAAGTLQRDQREFYTVPVGLDAKEIRVELTGTNDADLYTRFGSLPTRQDYDCRPYKGSSNEICNHAVATTGDLQIMVRGYSFSPAEFQLTVTWR